MEKAFHKCRFPPLLQDLAALGTPGYGVEWNAELDDWRMVMPELQPLRRQPKKQRGKKRRLREQPYSYAAPAPQPYSYAAPAPQLYGYGAPAPYPYSTPIVWRPDASCPRCAHGVCSGPHFY